MKPDISVIIPFLNEEENLPHLTGSLEEYCRLNSQKRFEVIFVDDGSKDGSFTFLKNYQSANYASTVIKLSKNYGSHAALRAGISIASGNFITFVYADLQDPLDLIDRMYGKCQAENQIVWAVRESTEENFSTKVFSKSYSYMMKNYAISTYPERGFDVVMFNTQVKELLNANIESNSSIFLQILTFGFKQETITYQKRERKRGKSKWTLQKKIKLFIDSFVAFSFAPIRLVSITGIAFFILGSIWTMYIVLREIFIGDLQPGWPALISILMIGFGVTNIALGIIAEYLWRTLDASRKRPVFIIDKIVKLS